MKWLGFLFMLIDHFGLFFFPNILFFRLIGRLAYPCFLYGVALGVNATSDPYRYAGRLFFMGLLGMLAWGRLMPLNVGFSLGILVLGLYAYKQKKYTLVYVFGLLSVFVEYGLYGYLFGLLLYRWTTTNNRQRQITVLLIIVLHGIIGLFDQVQFFALGFFLLWWFVGLMAQKELWSPRVPKLFGYLFYPVHIGVFRLFLGLF